jgi:hypothetical protein
MPAASSAKLSDKPSWVNRRDRKSGAPARAIVAELIQRASENSADIFLSGCRR